MDQSPAVYICIPVHNDVELTLKCLMSISRQTYQNYTVVLVDDGSTDQTEERVKKEFPKTVVLKGDGNLWWSGATALAVSYALKNAAPEDCIYTLNNDTELMENTLEKLVEAHRNHPKALIGTLNVVFEDKETIELSAFSRQMGWPMKDRMKKLTLTQDSLPHHKDVLEVYALSGKGVLVPVSVFEAIGNYNATDLPHYHADTEFTIRAYRAGFKILLSTKARLYSHHKRTGIGTRATQTTFHTFLESFRTLRSPHHLSSLTNFNKIIHGKWYQFYLMMDLFFITGGFLKRTIASPFK
jgi:GT2 family glycosyltransferase